MEPADYEEPLEAANKTLEAANKTLRAANKTLEAKNSKFEALVRTACDKLEANAFNFENEKSRQEATIEDLLTKNCRLEAANERIRLEYEDLKDANDELGTANEDLKAANERIRLEYEDLKAANEDLKAANGELPQVYWTY